MTRVFLNIFTVIFLSFFCFTIFETATSNSVNAQSRYFRVKSHPIFDQEFSGKTHVIDGDSIRVDGNEVRLVGLDAPEYYQTCFDKDNSEYRCGKISSKFLRNLAQNKHVKCLYAEKDRYNRFLGKCFIGDVSINEEIVKNGMAVIYNFTESDKKMDDLEIAAKKQKLGIWQGAFQLPKDYRKSHSRYK